MILWTVEPLERVFPSELPKKEFIEIDGGILEVIKNGDKTEVSGLVSTNQRLYLKSEYAPGYRIN